MHFDPSGSAKVDITVDGTSLSRDTPEGIIGRAVIVHAEIDDLMTDPTATPATASRAV